MDPELARNDLTFLCREDSEYRVYVDWQTTYEVDVPRVTSATDDATAIARFNAWVTTISSARRRMISALESAGFGVSRADWGNDPCPHSLWIHLGEHQIGRVAIADQWADVCWGSDGATRLFECMPVDPEGTLVDDSSTWFDSDDTDAVCAWAKDTASVFCAAALFTRELEATIGLVLLSEAVLDNVDEPHAGVCHTHDHCDANECMADALTRLGFDMSEGCPDEAHDLWNAAWALAKRHHFTHPHF